MKYFFLLLSPISLMSTTIDSPIKAGKRMISDHKLLTDVIIKPRAILHECWKTYNECWRMIILFEKQKRNLHKSILSTIVKTSSWNSSTMKASLVNTSIMAPSPTNSTVIKSSSFKPTYTKRSEETSMKSSPHNSALMKSSTTKSTNIKPDHRKFAIIKRSQYSLSITNSLDVLRKKLLEEIRRRENHRSGNLAEERYLDQLG